MKGEREGLLLLDEALVPGRVRFEGGKITSVERSAPAAPRASGEPIIAPGLIDLHVHGYAGRDPL